MIPPWVCGCTLEGVNAGGTIVPSVFQCCLDALPSEDPARRSFARRRIATEAAGLNRGGQVRRQRRRLPLDGADCRLDRFGGADPGPLGRRCHLPIAPAQADSRRKLGLQKVDFLPYAGSPLTVPPLV